MSISPEALKLTSDNNVFFEGTLALYDTLFNGMIPCKVMSIKEQCYGYKCGPYDTVEIKLTADRGAYKKGEILTVAASACPPKTMIRKRKYGSRIITTYSYKSKTPA